MEKKYTLFLSDSEDSRIKYESRNISQMVESQNIAKIYRAQNNLKAIMSLRSQNDKLFKEKELDMLRNKEIRFPLEEALIEIELLRGKVERREDTITKLRKYISYDLAEVKSMTYEERRQKSKDLNEFEEMKLIKIKDEYAELLDKYNKQEAKLNICKRQLKFQGTKIKTLQNKADSADFLFNEKLRKVEGDKDIYMSILETRESKIEMLMEEKDEIENELEEKNEEIDDYKYKLEVSKKELETIKENYERCDKEKNDLMIKHSKCVEDLNQTKESLIIMTERKEDIQNRYDKLIVELDSMVQDGYYISNGDEEPETSKASVPESEVQEKSSNKAKLMEKKKSKSKLSDRKNSQNSLSMKSIKSKKSILKASNSKSLLPSDGGIEFNLNPDNAEEAIEFNKKGRFFLRKIEEDDLSEERIKANAAIRMKDSLINEINELKLMLETEKKLRHEEVQEIKSHSNSLHMNNLVMSDGINRANTKNRELEAQLKELQEKYEEAIGSSDGEGRVGRESKILKRLSQVDATGQNEKFVDQSSQTDDVLIFDGSEHINDEVIESPPPEVDDENTLAYIMGEVENNKNNNEDADNSETQNKLWDNVNINSKVVQTIQPEISDQGSQFNSKVDTDYEGFFLDRIVQTNLDDADYPIEYYLEQIFRDYVYLSRRYVPHENLDAIEKDHFKLSKLDSRTRLSSKVSDEDMTLKEMQFKVKSSLIYLVTLNNIRNKHVKRMNSIGVWNTTNSRMVIRCVDLVLQTLHIMLCPKAHLKKSEYPELLRAADSDDESFYSDIDDEEDSNASKFYRNKEVLKQRFKRQSHVINKYKNKETFPLTETILTTDTNSGAPRGVLNPTSPFTPSSIRYMNQSTSPRKLPINIDEVLDQMQELLNPENNPNVHLRNKFSFSAYSDDKFQNILKKKDDERKELPNKSRTTPKHVRYASPPSNTRVNSESEEDRDGHRGMTEQSILDQYESNISSINGYSIEGEGIESAPPHNPNVIYIESSGDEGADLQNKGQLDLRVIKVSPKKKGRSNSPKKLAPFVGPKFINIIDRMREEERRSPFEKTDFIDFQRLRVEPEDVIVHAYTKKPKTMGISAPKRVRNSIQIASEEEAIQDSQCIDLESEIQLSGSQLKGIPENRYLSSPARRAIKYTNSAEISKSYQMVPNEHDTKKSQDIEITTHSSKASNLSANQNESNLKKNHKTLFVQTQNLDMKEEVDGIDFSIKNSLELSPPKPTGALNQGTKKSSITSYNKENQERKTQAKPPASSAPSSSSARSRVYKYSEPTGFVSEISDMLKLKGEPIYASEVSTQKSNTAEAILRPTQREFNLNSPVDLFDQLNGEDLVISGKQRDISSRNKEGQLYF